MIDSTIFFDLGVNTNEVAKLFDDHLQGLGAFSRPLAHIEMEMACTVEIINKALLGQQLEQL